MFVVVKLSRLQLMPLSLSLSSFPPLAWPEQTDKYVHVPLPGPFFYKESFIFSSIFKVMLQK